MKARKGFTLIELLIVVAIIAILAAIAVPNFLEAQTRSKVSRAQADIRALTTAIESYHTDNNAYPVPYYEQALSTPIAYISDAFYEDPFGDEDASSGGRHRYRYAPWDPRDGTAEAFWNGIMVPVIGFTDQERAAFIKHRYYIYSNGPDRIAEVYNFATPPGTVVTGTPFLVALGRQFEAMYDDNICIYDPTNGTVSRGDVIRTGAGILKGALIGP